MNNLLWIEVHGSDPHDPWTATLNLDHITGIVGTGTTAAWEAEHDCAV